ncbi:HlyD family secretion protein [Flagellimonas onchidii]|uniref:HlyD family secretion protein n=1 Tax=Flagellimonas onchidii TaxID=2562684 RepID=UPI0010A68E06|nr:HlyD family efflux transporter periplasmic adaptor subunit [Allomuricauda onchidii]
MEEDSLNYTISSDINEIIERKPNWLVRYGIGSILCCLLIILLIAWIVKYPDLVEGNVSIVTPKPPIDIISKSNSTIEIDFGRTENDIINPGDPIFLLENTASYHQIKLLQEELLLSSSIDSIPDNRQWLDSLGGIQSIYNSYKLSKLNLINYNNEKPYDKRLKNLKSSIAGSNKGVQYSEILVGSSKENYEYQRKKFKRYQSLFEKGVISELEYENHKQSLLQLQMNHTNNFKNYHSESQSINNLEGKIIELEIQKNEYEEKLKLEYYGALNELKSVLKSWESQYLIVSTIRGRLSFFSDLNKGDFVAVGERLFTIIPVQEDKLQAIGVFPSTNIGKVKVGQDAIIKLNAFPYHEYGTINGRVNRISEIPMNNSYNIIIELPNKLETNYKNKIEFKQRLDATASIITKDQSLLKRMFFQFENIFKN